MQARERVRGLEARPPVRKDPATPERAGWASKRTCAQAHLSAAAHRVIGMYLSHALSVSRRPRLLSVSLTVAVVGRVHAGDHSGAFRRAPCPVPWAGPRRGLAARSTASGRICSLFFAYKLRRRATARNRGRPPSHSKHINTFALQRAVAPRRRTSWRDRRRGRPDVPSARHGRGPGRATAATQLRGHRERGVRPLHGVSGSHIRDRHGQKRVAQTFISDTRLVHAHIRNPLIRYDSGRTSSA